MKDRGSISIYWLILILLVVEVILLALAMTLKGHTLANSKADFLRERIYLENLSEQTKYLAYKLVEDTCIEALEYTNYMTDLLDGKLTEQDKASIYEEFVRTYTARKLIISNACGDSKFDSRERLALMGYP